MRVPLIVCMLLLLRRYPGGRMRGCRRRRCWQWQQRLHARNSWGERGRPIVKICSMLSEKTDFHSDLNSNHARRRFGISLEKFRQPAVGRPSASACLLPILMPMLLHGRRHDISNVHLRKRIPVLSAQQRADDNADAPRILGQARGVPHPCIQMDNSLGN